MKNSALRVALFPGTFDPFTLGHEDIVNRALPLFDSVIIAIGHNPNKSKRYFDVEYIIEKITSLYQNEKKVEVEKYNELTAFFAKKRKANWIIRGLRNTTDFEYENSISQLNKNINEELETIFLITHPHFAPISSTIIREVHKYNGDVSQFLPYSL